VDENQIRIVRHQPEKQVNHEICYEAPQKDGSTSSFVNHAGENEIPCHVACEEQTAHHADGDLTGAYHIVPHHEVVERVLAVLDYRPLDYVRVLAEKVRFALRIELL
jgi:hypothetical protein